MDEPTLKMFWSLATSETQYQSEVFKIIQDSSVWLMLKHVEFFYDQLTQQQAEKLSVAEFDCLVDLGKFCNEESFQTKIGDFFWRVIVQSGAKKDLVDKCIKKYSEMVRLHTTEQKIELLTKLINQISAQGASVT